MLAPARYSLTRIPGATGDSRGAARERSSTPALSNRRRSQESNEIVANFAANPTNREGEGWDSRIHPSDGELDASERPALPESLDRGSHLSAVQVRSGVPVRPEGLPGGAEPTLTNRSLTWSFEWAAWGSNPEPRG